MSSGISVYQYLSIVPYIDSALSPAMHPDPFEEFLLSPFPILAGIGRVPHHVKPQIGKPAVGGKPPVTRSMPNDGVVCPLTAPI
ncbi:MAG: hypothetical protein IPO71_12105 [Nitrosomonas sp.]|nr:hypothetical protein [Nitrosomonas sp.]